MIGACQGAERRRLKLLAVTKLKLRSEQLPQLRSEQR